MKGSTIIIQPGGKQKSHRDLQKQKGAKSNIFPMSAKNWAKFHDPLRPIPLKFYN